MVNLNRNKNVRTPFIVTIDTEGDNLWNIQSTMSTGNARFLPRFQSLCGRYGFKPTYLTTFEMAVDPFFKEFASAALSQGQCEIGVHIHAWNSPPVGDPVLDGNDKRTYLIEYEADVIERKVDYLTKLMQDTFGVRIKSHRAGRWALDGNYVDVLSRLGYSADCSVTPYIDWSDHRGTTRGGVNYSGFPIDAYKMDPRDISKRGPGKLVQVPMTIRRMSWPLREAIPPLLVEETPLKRVANRFFPEISWLRPNGKNLRPMLRLLEDERTRGAGYVQFMLHSSELMPGGSPTFTTQSSIDRLYDHIEQLFQSAARWCAGYTLREFAGE